MTKFKATNEQVIQMATNAVNASRPVGMGMLQYQPNDLTTDQIKGIMDDDGFSLDYVQGRMVKMRIKKLEGSLWQMQYETNTEYQSWGTKYPTAHDLIKSAGITVATNMVVD